MPLERCRAFGPGRVNLIGEHTDYNDGLALPFAIAEGVYVSAALLPGGEREGPGARIDALALDLDERDSFALADPPPSEGWRAFVRGVAAELAADGWTLRGARLEIHGEVPQGAGLSSSAALEVALCLALTALAAGAPVTDVQQPNRFALARACARAENRWVGAQTGMLDQLASLFGEAEYAVLIDFRAMGLEPVPLPLHGWRLAVLDSGERHSHASSGYNDRRAECARASELLGVSSLREANVGELAPLPEPLQSRARHVVEEIERVRRAVAALRAGDLPAVGKLLDAAHASLRDLYEVSTPAVERAVALMRAAGAAGARVVGGGFGGSVLGLFPPGIELPAGAREVKPGTGAHLLPAG